MLTHIGRHPCPMDALIWHRNRAKASLRHYQGGLQWIVQCSQILGGCGRWSEATHKSHAQNVPGTVPGHDVPVPGIVPEDHEEDES